MHRTMYLKYPLLSPLLATLFNFISSGFSSSFIPSLSSYGIGLENVSLTLLSGSVPIQTDIIDPCHPFIIFLFIYIYMYNLSHSVYETKVQSQKLSSSRILN